MSDLKSPKLMYLKGGLFVAIGLISAVLMVVLTRDWRVAVLLALCVWAWCRSYYFAFYVIEHYIDGEYRFAGLIDFVRYLLGRKK
ncbi:hypothetical protein [Aeoliella mucimassa]|uniref:Uncharacterized protein n=1 Tax=Aeoliella mucimassa TaxID=2527972 RepID=A0A518ATB0_9BACT|nr:hypothetical protein [Aeoliella mucimassa]QDU57969.1 hypothetical protein Pan181_41940 [Aeoliella mucimassa]